MPRVADDAEADVLLRIEVAPTVGWQRVVAVVVEVVVADLLDGGSEGAGEFGWGDEVAGDEEVDGDGGEGDGPGDGGERGEGRVGVGECCEVEGWWW